MNKFNKKFAGIQLSKVKVYCQPEVFAMGCFFEPSMRQQKNVTDYLKNKLGSKFTNYSIQNEMVWVCYQWFLPSVDYKGGKFHMVSNRFWKSNTAGTIAHKLPTIRDKDFQLGLGISDKTSRVKLLSLISTKLVKTYIDEAKSVNPKYTKIRYVQLNVPLMLAITYDREDIHEAWVQLGMKMQGCRFLQDVVSILQKALDLQDKM